MNDERSKPGPARTATRRPYVAPRVTSDQKFETLALACDKVTGDFGDPCGPPNQQQS